MGFLFILSPELKEISYCNMRIKKNMWFSSNTILSVVLFLPYAIILALISEKYFFNVPVIFFQCVLAGIMTFFLMHFLKSALRRFISYVLIMLYLKSFLLLYWEYYQKIIELIGISLKSFL